MKQFMFLICRREVVLNSVILCLIKALKMLLIQKFFYFLPLKEFQQNNAT